MEWRISVGIFQPKYVDHLQRWSRIFRSEETETNLSTLIQTEIYGIFGIMESTHRVQTTNLKNLGYTFQGEELQFSSFKRCSRWSIPGNYILTGTAGCSAGFPPLCSDMGVAGTTSSFGSTMLTWSGRGFLGPVLPVGSHGSMIFTLIPSTPDDIKDFHWKNCNLKVLWNSQKAHFSKCLCWATDQMFLSTLKSL